MNQVFLKFRDLELGYLTKENEHYVWVPNTRDLQIFFKDYSAVSDLFFLNSKQPQAYKTIPAHFNEYLEGANRSDLAKKAQINPSDDDFEKLCKLASLTYFGQDFIITI